MLLSVASWVDLCEIFSMLLSVAYSVDLCEILSSKELSLLQLKFSNPYKLCSLIVQNFDFSNLEYLI